MSINPTPMLSPPTAQDDSSSHYSGDTAADHDSAIYMKMRIPKWQNQVPQSTSPNKHSPTKSTYGSIVSGSSLQSKTIVWKPSSKTYLGSLQYPQPKMPCLLLVEVDISTEATGNEKATFINSHLLKRKALQEFTSEALGDEELANSVAFLLDTKPIDHSKMKSTDISKVVGTVDNQDDVKKRTNLLIIPVDHEKLATTTFGKLQEQSAKPLKVTKKLSSKKAPPMTSGEAKSGEQQSDENIICKIIQSGRYLDPTSPDELYAKCITTLFNDLVRRSDSTKFGTLGTSFLSKLNNTYGTQFPNSYYDLALQFKPSFETPLDGAAYALNFAVDLVPVIYREIGVLEFAKHQVLLEDIDVCKKLKEVLCGMFVRDNQDKQSSGTPHAEFPRILRIRDLKTDKEIGQILPSKVKEGTFVTVKTYLRQCNIKFDETVKHLPLADIGRNKSFWVPLDFLTLQANQPLKKTGQLSLELQRQKQDIQSNQIDDFLRFHGNTLFTQVRKAISNANYTSIIKSILNDIPRNLHVTITPNLQLPTAEPVVRSNKQKDPATNDQFYEFSIVYVGRYAKTEPVEKFLKSLKTAIAAAQPKLTGKKANEIPSTSIVSARELIISGAQDTSPLMECVKGAKVLLGVIDRDDMEEEQYKDIKAEMYRLGDRKVGAVTLCVSRQHLANFVERPDNQATFPPNIRRKIRFMRGHGNWKSNPMQLWKTSFLPDKNIIIVGAHITHPSSKSAEGCPSVAALVTSREKVPHHYLAYTQLQQTFQPSNEKTKKSTRSYQSGILDLETLLKQLLTDWKKQIKPKKSDRPHIIFYRDACSSTSQEPYSNEADHITEAYRKIFDVDEMEEIPISYIIVAKHTHDYNAENNKESKPTFHFTTRRFQSQEEDDLELAEDDAGKYQYMVTQSVGFDREQLKILTANLNTSSDLCECTSTALPIHFARKLGRRVLNYYDFISKDTNSILQLARRTAGVPDQAAMLGDVRDFLRTDRGGVAGVRGDGNTEVRPWKMELDDKMFYL
ncbi:hypothetical protein P280DRAFT_538913 [Massarina eburnea CBS 473.64]|uniref:Piwi domain-containing protein n=1 Tax=Massarina eburnea CBS 473.64 TaxID=1395130 RepID=A0A6A6S772_9PLEO|nr:hypothetical protein P280DRAFT_538913 [Massarina eburnea CBS 473.64]